MHHFRGRDTTAAGRQPVFCAFFKAGRVLAWLALALLSLDLALPVAGAAPVRPDQAAGLPGPANVQYSYVEATGHSLIGPVARYYNLNGGESRHGRPLSELVREKGRYRQYFERSVLEFYPEYNGSGAEVRLSPAGRLVAERAGPAAEPVRPFTSELDRWYFPETGHSLGGPFLTFWARNGANTLLGRPLTEEFSQDGPEGSRLSVQYFEYVRLQRPAGAMRTEDVSIANLGAELAGQNLRPEQLAPLPRARFTAPRTVRVPSLMFHYARIVDARQDPLGFGLSVTPGNYTRFLDWVKDNGYNTVTVSQINDYFRYGILLPDRPVNFRWDDGHDNNWFVYQEMKKRGMTATFYVVSQRLELSPAQWKQIDEDGFEVAAHTRTHADLRTVKDLAGEITGSKRDLEAILGHPVRTFAYPYGKYTEAARRVVRESGFEMAVSTNGGYNWSLDTMLEQPVISVTGYDDLRAFANKIKAAGQPEVVAARPPAPVAAPVPANPVNKAGPPAVQKALPTAVPNPNPPPKR